MAGEASESNSHLHRRSQAWGVGTRPKEGYNHAIVRLEVRLSLFQLRSIELPAPIQGRIQTIELGFHASMHRSAVRCFGDVEASISDSIESNPSAVATIDENG